MAPPNDSIHPSWTQQVDFPPQTLLLTLIHARNGMSHLVLRAIIISLNLRLVEQDYFSFYIHISDGRNGLMGRSLLYQRSAIKLWGIEIKLGGSDVGRSNDIREFSYNKSSLYTKSDKHSLAFIRIRWAELDDGGWLSFINLIYRFGCTVTVS